MSSCMTYETLNTAWQYIDHEEAFFLKNQLKHSKQKQPLKGKRILHNIPLSLETACKIQALLASGAEVVATWPSNIIPTSFNQAKKFLEAAGVACLEKPQIKGTFDFHLDCGAQLLHLPVPQIGCVELTGTGSQIYRQQKHLNYPVISIDDSQTKALETFYGTSEACIRALKEKFGINLESLNALIIGFGRVGKGVAYALAKEGSSIHILDINERSSAYAQKHGFAFALSHTDRAKAFINKASLILTASGVENLISDSYDPSHFRGKWLANVGAEDEFGHLFTCSEVLNQKQPINFALEKSTAMRYLDPSLYLHSYGCELLLEHSFSPGYHPLPTNVDQWMLETWQSQNKENLAPMKESLL